MSTIRIRIAGEADLQVIREIAMRVWPGTYGAILPEGQIDYMLEMMYSIPSLKQQLDEGNQFILAEDGDKIYGFAGFSETEPGKLKLHKLYILPESQGKGIGKILMDYVKQYGRSIGARLLYLNVNKYNSAFNFYLRSGFRVLSEEVIDIGNGYVMDDYVMGIEID